MENPKILQRSDRVQIIPDQMIHELEDKQLDLCFGDYQKTLGSYRKKRFWPMMLSLAGFWLILPPWFFFKFLGPKKALDVVVSLLFTGGGDI